MKPLEFPDATEAEMKTLNADPGVSSNLHIDKIAHTTPLSTINESNIPVKPCCNRSMQNLKVENSQRNRLNSEPDVGNFRHRKFSESGLKNSRGDVDKTVPVMIRKDIYYSGSIQNLKEFQSQKSLQAYKSSNASLNRRGSRFENQVDAKKSSNSIIDFSLLTNPVFVMLAISNLFGKFYKLLKNLFNNFFIRYGCTVCSIFLHAKRG